MKKVLVGSILGFGLWLVWGDLRDAFTRMLDWQQYEEDWAVRRASRERHPCMRWHGSNVQVSDNLARFNSNGQPIRGWIDELSYEDQVNNPIPVISA